MQVAAKAQEDDLPFHRYKTQAIVEVMVDLLLDAEGVTVHEGLVFVLDEGLESYPVSGIRRGRSALCVALMYKPSVLSRWRF